MLETTFLGHQGWQFATDGARILVDPLLVEAFGHDGGIGVVYPPRSLDIAAMAPVDAVFFTHEHEDHFNIPSVNRLSRDIPIYAPERASIAMRKFLAELGFKVVPVSPGQTIEIGDLRFVSFSPDHIRHDEQDEWETTPFLVIDATDGGSFFSPVDVTASEAIQEQLKQLGVTPGLWGYANNMTNLSFQEQPPRPSPAMQPMVARFVAEHRRRTDAPLASLMCGGGFSFTGPRTWMNNVFFPLDSDKLFDGMQANNPNERFIVVSPGMQIISDKTKIKSVAQSAPFLRTLPREKWPDRTYAPQKAAPQTVTPASGRTELRTGELEDLNERLVEFAEFLYGSLLFRSLYSLTNSTLPPGVQAKFAINAMSGDEDHVFEYDPSSCTFVLLEKPRPMSRYAAGVECFASDLLEFLRGRLPPSALMFGRLLRWSGGLEIFTQAIDHAIWAYGHPLRRPAEYLDFYRSIHAKEPAETPKVRERSK